MLPAQRNKIDISVSPPHNMDGSKADLDSIDSSLEVVLAGAATVR